MFPLLCAVFSCSGGYNLKAGPGSMIQMMKFDMGAARPGGGQEQWGPSAPQRAGALHHCGVRT